MIINTKREKKSHSFHLKFINMEEDGKLTGQFCIYLQIYCHKLFNVHYLQSIQS